MTDSILHVFMYFFNDEANKLNISPKKRIIIDHYELELNELNTSFIDLKLNDVYSEIELKKWYLLILEKINISISSFGTLIAADYLNNVKGLKKQFNKPIPVVKINNLIKDLTWILNEDINTPSEEYKWYEKPNH